MDKNHPERACDGRQAGTVPLTLDFVLTEVVRILDEERANQENRKSRRLAA
jgi:hypothetical protein